MQRSWMYFPPYGRAHASRYRSARGYSQTSGHGITVKKKGVFSVGLAYRMLACTKDRGEAWLDETATSSDHHGGRGKLDIARFLSSCRFFCGVWQSTRCRRWIYSKGQRHHTSPSNACGICGAVGSWRHSRLDYTISCSVWALVDEELTEHMSQAQELDARRWLFMMINSVSHIQLTRMCVTLWAILHARRKPIHDGIFQSPQVWHVISLQHINIKRRCCCFYSLLSCRERYCQW
jgi:hypothetical protein